MCRPRSASDSERREPALSVESNIVPAREGRWPAHISVALRARSHRMAPMLPGPMAIGLCVLNQDDRERNGEENMRGGAPLLESPE
jgi:hypothetical protein